MKNPFRKHTARHIAPMPSWEEIVPMMYDKGLDGWSDEIVQVVYSPEHSERFIIMKSEHGYYKYVYEILHQFDEEEWMYIGSQLGALPAMWEPVGDNCVSLFSGMEEALEAIKALPEYKLHFLSED